MRYLLIIFSLVLINPFLLAVGEAGAIFLLISPSPTINGFGGAGTSVSTTDVYSSYYNPAQPQLPSGLSIQSSNSKTDWLSNLVPDIDYNYDVKMIGYNGFSYINRYKLQASITKSTTSLDLGEQFAIDEYGNELGSFRSYMTSDAMTYSLGIKSEKLPIFFGMGITTKEAKQVLGQDFSSTDQFYDWGFRFSLYDYKLKINPIQVQNIKLIENIGLNYSIGYSKSNIGDPIVFIDEDQADPAPTTSRLGMTFGGSFFVLNDLDIEFKLIREAEDLISKDGYLGDIDIVKHIFLGSSDENIVIHKGSEITFSNSLSFRTGQYIDLEGAIECKTMGLGIDFGESIKFASDMLFDSLKIKLFDYVNLKYNVSYYSLDRGHPLAGTTFNELTLSVKNIDNIFKR